MRRVSPILIACLAAIGLALLAWAPHAGATNSGVGGGSNTGGPLSPSGPSSGIATWWEVHNINRGPNYNKQRFNRFRDRSDKDDSLAERRKVQRAATRALVEHCRNSQRRITNNSIKSRGCPLWYNTEHRSSVNNKRTTAEIHSAYPDRVHMVTPNILVGYNVKIWRENPRAGKFDLIFERRVGINGESDPLFDPPSTLKSSKQWWYGGLKNAAEQRGSFSARGRKSAGMVGNWSGNARKRCWQNWRRGANGQRREKKGNAGKRVPSRARLSEKELRRLERGGWQWCYWEGDDIGPKAFKWASGPNLRNDPAGVRNFQRQWGRPAPYTKGAAVEQFGHSPRSLKAARTMGLKEAIRIQWKAPLRSGKNKIRYVIDGAPGLFYVVQIVGIDSREQIMPLQPTVSRNSPLRATSFRGQLFKAFIANPLKKPCCPGTRTVEQESAIEGTLTLEPQTLLQTREPSSQAISLSVDDEVAIDQAIFPQRLTLDHFTPQFPYSSARAAGSGAATYPPDYISYGVERQGQTIRRANLPARYVNGAAALAGRNLSDEQLQLKRARMITPAWLDPQGAWDNLATLNPVADDPSPAAFNLTWLRPTLESPCLTTPPLPFPRNQAKPWPARLSQCPSDNLGFPRVFNAWDDLLEASGQWEERWGRWQGNEDELRKIGRVERHPLRCASLETTENCRAADQWYPLLRADRIANTSGRDQYAQGYLLVADENDGVAEARVILRTNRPERVSHAIVQEREGPTTITVPGSELHRGADRVRADLKLPIPEDEDAAGYVVTFVFSGLSDAELNDSGGACPAFAGNPNEPVPGTCWRMLAEYDGYVNLTWKSRFVRSKPNDESMAFVKVFGPRNDR